MAAADSSVWADKRPSPPAPDLSFSDDFPPLFASLKTFSLAEFPNVVKGNPFGVKIPELKEIEDRRCRAATDEIAQSSRSGAQRGPRVSRDDRDMGFSEDDDDGDCSGSMVKGNPLGLKKRDFKKKEGTLRIQRGLAAMWPTVAAISNPESMTKDDAAFAARVALAAAQVAAADAAAAYAAAAYAAYAAYAAAAAAAPPPPRPENLNPETKVPLDNPSRNANVGARHVSINHELELKLWSEKARKALEYYKDTKGEDFELVEMMNSETAVHAPYLFYHITFMAERKYISDSCPELFFAELYESFDRDGEFVFTTCMILDPSGQDVRKGCDFVRGAKNMPHPKGVKFFVRPPA